MRELESIAVLINKFRRLPGVGTKTAQRYAYSIIDMTEAEAADFCDAVMTAKRNVRYCAECGGFTDTDTCAICRERDNRTLCVVAYPKDVAKIEQTNVFKGRYHVLHGTISPVEGRAPEDIRIKELLSHLDGTEEVIVATNPDIEGEATALYLARLIKPLGIKVTRLAQGISLGSDIEYADELTLSRALESRISL